MSAQRRICWPDPDATCLEGGCSYCNDHPFRSVRAILRYSLKAGDLPNRGDGKSQAAVDAFYWGSQHRWGNAESR